MYGTVEHDGESVAFSGVAASRGFQRLNGTRNTSPAWWIARALLPVSCMGLALWMILHIDGTGEIDPDTNNLAQAEMRHQETFREPERLTSRDGKLETTFHIKVARVSFDSGVAFNARSINGLAQGPTLVVRQGDTLTINVKNQLGDARDVHDVPNTIRRPNTTILHTHGLHISPSGTADNMYHTVQPGEAFKHVYAIPKNHPVGTFYIHAHIHGSSALQTGYMMSSALIVRGAQDTEEFQQDLVMLVGKVDIGSGSRSDILELERISESRMDLDLTGPMGSFLTVNGKASQELHIEKHRWMRWRVVNVVLDGFLLLSLRSPDNSSALVSGRCHAEVLAADGVDFSAPRKVSRGILIPPGSRRDVAVRCSGDAALVSSNSSDSSLAAYIGGNTKLAIGELLRVKVKPNASESTPVPFDPAQARGYLPEPLGDLRKVTSVRQDTIVVSQHSPREPKQLRHGANYTFVGFNETLFDPTKPLVTVVKDQVIDWVISNEQLSDGSPAIESHPFHLHTNHFQIVDVSSLSGNAFEQDFAVGDFRDTISIPAPGSVTIRWAPRDFTGMTMFHCHTLVHEDIGMAARLDIIQP